MMTPMDLSRAELIGFVAHRDARSPRKMAEGGTVGDIPPLFRPWNEAAFERELAARGLSGPAPFTWASSGPTAGSLKLDDPHLTEAQRAAILDARLAATDPAAPIVNDPELFRFLDQRGALSGLPNGGGSDVGAPGETGPGTTTTGIEGGRASADPAFAAFANPFGKEGLNMDPALALGANLAVNTVASLNPVTGAINAGRNLGVGMGRIGDALSNFAFSPATNSIQATIQNALGIASVGPPGGGFGTGKGEGEAASYAGRTGSPSETGATGYSSTGVPFGGPGRSPDLTALRESEAPGVPVGPPSTTAPPTTDPVAEGFTAAESAATTSGQPTGVSGPSATGQGESGPGGTGAPGEGGSTGEGSGASGPGGDAAWARGGRVPRATQTKLGGSFKGAKKYQAGGGVPTSYYSRGGSAVGHAAEPIRGRRYLGRYAEGGEVSGSRADDINGLLGDLRAADPNYMDRVPSFGERTNFPTLRDALHSTAADLGIGPVTPWQYDPQVGRLYQSPVTSPGHWLISPDQKRVDAATVGSDQPIRTGDASVASTPGVVCAVTSRV